MKDLTLTLLTWTKWWAPASASKWQMGFNSAFKGLITNFIKKGMCLQDPWNSPSDPYISTEHGWNVSDI